MQKFKLVLSIIVSKYYLLWWAAIFSCPFLVLSQSNSYVFININNNKTIDFYTLVFYSNDAIDYYNPDATGRTVVPETIILLADSIILASNFQRKKLEKIQFKKEIVRIDLITELEEIIISNKDNSDFIGANKGYKPPLVTEKSYLSICLKAKADSMYSVENIIIPIQRKGSIDNEKSFNSKFEIKFYAADKNLNNVERISRKTIYCTVQKRRNHELTIDLSDFDIVKPAEKILIIDIEFIQGKIGLKTAPAKNNLEFFLLNKSTVDYFTENPYTKYKAFDGGVVPKIRVGIQYM